MGSRLESGRVFVAVRLGVSIAYLSICVARAPRRVPLEALKRYKQCARRAARWCDVALIAQFKETQQTIKYLLENSVKFSWF